eukprot:PITA_25730
MSIVEAARAMLYDQKLPKFTWVEATNNTVYVQNRLPHQALDNKTPKEVFSGVKLDIGHLRILGCPVYFHVPKDKRNKLEAIGRKDTALRKARDLPPPTPPEDNSDKMNILEGPFVPESKKDIVDDPMEPMDPLDPPCDPPTRKRPLWLKDTLQDADKHVVAQGTFRESKKPCRYQAYVVAMNKMIQAEPSTFEEFVKEQVWKDAMTEEYESIMKNDVWDIVPRPKGRSVVTSKWLYKIKNWADGRIKKYKSRFVAHGFTQKEGEYYDDIFSLVARYTTTVQ